MELGEYLNTTGYTQSVDDLDAIKRERDRFAQIIRFVQPLPIRRAYEALAALDASIEASEAALADEYEKAVRYVNTIYARENGIAIVNDLIPRISAGRDGSGNETPA